MSQKKEQTNAIKSHIPKITTDDVPINNSAATIGNFFYDLVIVLAYFICHIFFREVEVVGIHNIPKSGPVILVCGPHANQFIDAAVIYVPVKLKRGRNISSVIAESSYKSKFIGLLAKLVDSIPVARAQDNLKLAQGSIYVDVNHINDETATIINGKGTRFTDFEVGGVIGLPQKLGNFKIKQIESDEELILAKPVSSPSALKLLKQSSKFKYCNKVNTNEAFQNVFNHLYRKGLIAIFPEGGSHDQTKLLPLKPGVAIMALGSIAAITDQIPDASLTIVPTGLYYFHRNKFRSRAVVEFGQPLEVTKIDGQNYINNPKQTVDRLLVNIKLALESTTINAPNQEFLRTVQAIRRLYRTPGNRHMNLATVNETNRRILVGYNNFRDHKKIQFLFNSVQDYNKKLYNMGLKDHQLKTAGFQHKSKLNAVRVFVRRLVKLFIFGILSLPGVTLFAPVFIFVHFYSKKKQAEALKNSTVKVKAIDVVASWKVIVALAVAPILYVFYSVIGTRYILAHFNLGIHWSVLFVISYLVLVFTTYSAFRTGEVGTDILKSLYPLVLQILSSKLIVALIQEREKLSIEVTEVCNELGPDLFPDFDKFYKDGINEHVSLTKPKKSHSKEYSLSNISNMDFFASGGEEEDRSDNETLGSSYENVASAGAEINNSFAKKRE